MNIQDIGKNLDGYEVDSVEVAQEPADLLAAIGKSHRRHVDGSVYVLARLRKSYRSPIAKRDAAVKDPNKIIDRDGDGMVLDGTDRERPAAPHETYEKHGGTLKDPGASDDRGPYGGWKPDWKEKPDPAEFIAARDKMLEKKPWFKPFLSDVKPEDLKDHKVFLSADGKVGAAVSPEGDIQNVFNVGGPRGAGTEAIIAAIKAGGKTLDAYDDVLPTTYANFGFTETNRMKFNREYAPGDWDYDRFGEPDVVFMARTKGLSEEEMRSNAGREREQQRAPEKSTEYTEDWDGAKDKSRRAADASATGGGGNDGAANQRGDSAAANPGRAVGLATEKTTETPPPPTGIDVDLDADGDGVTDYSRVGVPGRRIPKKIPRLPNMTPLERAVETQFADWYEKDPHAAAAAYRKAIETPDGEGKYQIGEDPRVYNTDEAKELSDDYCASKESRSLFNCPVHQTANAIAKLAFVSKLNDIAKMPEGERKVLITAGGVAAGKGHALKANEDVKAMKESAAAIWDSAGDQYSTELPWIHDELEKRGIEGTYVFVHSDPEKTYYNEQGWGAVSRASKSGRMVDHIVHAESYHYGAKNYAAFQQNAQGTKAKFVIIDNYSGKPKIIDKIPLEQIPKPDVIAKLNEENVARSGAEDWVVRGAMVGKRVWKDAVKDETNSVN